MSSDTTRKNDHVFTNEETTHGALQLEHLSRSYVPGFSESDAAVLWLIGDSSLLFSSFIWL